MSRRCKPTDTNVAAARELLPRYARLAMAALGQSTAQLQAIANREESSPEEVIAAVARIRQLSGLVDRKLSELLGVAVLGGASVSTTARKVGVRPQTLAVQLAGTWAEAKGAALVPDPAAVDGWTVSR
jgi:hypothetical protein